MVIIAGFFVAAIAVYVVMVMGPMKATADETKMSKPALEGDMKDKLTPMQYHVTQENGTERPFDNEYWDHKEPGIYVDVVTGEALFSSIDKFDSGTGWPSFTKPIEKQSVAEKEDTALFMVRTEVRSSQGDSHLGHVFDDGPVEKGGLRYCINSASLRFVHKDDLEKEGYGEYLYLFEQAAAALPQSKAPSDAQ